METLTTLPVYRKRAIDELNRGYEFANKLQYMLNNPIKTEGFLFTKDLVAEILRSITETLLILESSNEFSEFQTNTHLGSPCSGVWKSEDSDECSKTLVVKDRRGCYKRRKTSQATTRITRTLIDDGYAWRKYGQKPIHNNPHPRNYFRCTHKFDQKCEATKQVQRTEDDPPMYRITYHGNHTCKKNCNDPQIIFDSTTRPESSFLFSFRLNSPINKENRPFFPITKQKYKETIPCFMNQNQSSSSSDYLLSNDWGTLDSYRPMSVFSSGSDHGDVISPEMYSCTTSDHSFEMDPIDLGSESFDDLFLFDL